MIQRISLMVCFLAVLAGSPASAQNWSFDARKVGLGSPTGSENLASRMIDDEREYRAIVLPFGLIQVFRDFDRLNPSNDEFDLVRTIEFAAAPIHYTIGRDRNDDSRADDFIVDIGNGELSRDLNVYKGFIPVNQPAAAGLAAPNWGKTFRVRRGDGGSFQGVYVGAGPYISTTWSGGPPWRNSAAACRANPSMAASNTASGGSTSAAGRCTRASCGTRRPASVST